MIVAYRYRRGGLSRRIVVTQARGGQRRRRPSVGRFHVLVDFALQSVGESGEIVDRLVGCIELSAVYRLRRAWRNLPRRDVGYRDQRAGDAAVVWTGQREGVGRGRAVEHRIRIGA